MNPLLAVLLLVPAVLSAPVAAQQSIVDSNHNLSVSGPGPFRSTTETEVCIFCHTPHRARGNAPLWNREDSVQTYTLYDSPTFQGTPGQPSGSSKLCLSCHDGSIALGLLHTGSVPMEPGHEFLDSGEAAIGTSLHDDHPISFDYATSRGGTSAEFVAAASIPHPIALDAQGMMQCTSCHDAHDNQYGDFLLVANPSQLCLGCHQPNGWGQSSHALSTATWDGVGPDPWPRSNYTTVAANSCANCHQSHTAAQPEQLLSGIEEAVCLNCHNGHVAQGDIAADLMKFSAHPVAFSSGLHVSGEDPFSMPRHVECADCHDPHEAQQGGALAPGVPGPLLGVSGINSTGTHQLPINNGYELCYACHADTSPGTAYVTRQVLQTNVRLEFDLGNPSFHPIEGAGTNNSVPSLIQPWDESSIVACTDCHQSDSSPDAGGTGPAGPHGSNISPLLLANYNTVDYVPETPTTYELCYRCHSRASLLADEGFRKHNRHIQGEYTSCGTCHDPHGISASQAAGSMSSHTHLINFDTNVVFPERRGSGLWFLDEGFQTGTCNLDCHGKNHKGISY